MLRKTLLPIWFLIFICSCTSSKDHEQIENLRNNIKNSTRIQVYIIPDRNSEMSFKALDISTKDSMSDISKFIGDAEPTHVTIFSSLPDGYLSLYEGDTHKQDIFFTLDSLHEEFQELETVTEFKMTAAGIDYLKVIYSNNALWEPKEIGVEQK